MHFLMIPSDGFKLPTIQSTASMTNPEFKEFIAKIQRWMAQDYGQVIPDPNQVDFL